ncbi:anti-sigma regulatory factor [Saccharopolyspora subtropica]|uniref:ATP-binding protein n=1 Tax=Saccharopolyspora thermophila TaxID=89367 RepID=A0A917JW80_9PSEU|nr:ATP-binding protein [Saccharopolyspora subtropica]GGI89355.1 anti-sigma regulatory factor [Saccharopolyspora subtropica]
MAVDESNAGPTAGDGRGVDAQVHHRRAPVRPGDLTALRDELADWGRRAGLTDEVVAALALACYEAMANVVEHAYVDAGAIEVRAERRNDRVRVTVADHGRWLPPDRRDAAVSRGRGIPLIHQLADEAVIIPGETGTVVEMTWQAPRN